jgi:hypothetical protein
VVVVCYEWFQFKHSLVSICYDYIFFSQTDFHKSTIAVVHRLPNQALPKGVPSGQADGCQLGTISMACNGQYIIESYQLYEYYQRRSLTPIR